MKFVSLLLLISLATSQVRIGEWNALTSPLNVREVLYLDDDLYAATEGGLFQIKDGEYRTFTTIEGILGVDLSAIGVDHKSQLWLGGAVPFGFVQIYDPEKEITVNSFDFGLSEIYDIRMLDSLAFVFFQDGQDVGIMKFLYDEGWEYRDSFRNFPQGTGTINCFIPNDSTLFLGTDNGIWVGDLKNNLKDPNQWSVIQGDIDMEVTSLALTDSSLVFSSKTAIYRYYLKTGVWSEIEFSEDFSNVNTVYLDGEDYWILDNKKLYLKTSHTDTMLYDRFTYSSIASSTNQVALGTSVGFVFVDKHTIEDSLIISRFIPNAPVTNKFSAITVLDDGRFVGGSNHGISIYSDKGWSNILEIKTEGTGTINANYDYTSFIADTISYDFGEYVADIEQGPDGLLYCAIRGTRVYLGNPPRWSGGILVMDIDDPESIMRIDTTYLSYFNTNSNPRPYMVVLDIEFDDSGNMWVANPYAINGNNPVHVRSPNGEWKHFGSAETSTKISQSPCSITIDSWSRTWVSAFQASEANPGNLPNGGIFMLDYTGDPINPESFTWEEIQGEGTIWSLAMGRNDRLFYLTPTGLNYYDIRDGQSPIMRENTYAYFPNISFGKGAELKMDSHGNVWTHSPSQGVHILLENTTYWPDINGFRMSNSPLLSDQVNDIVFDEKRNLVYIATSKGVNVLRIPFGQGKTTYSTVKVFPSPFFIPSDNPMKVDGLPYESSMMVMTLDGKVVKHVRSQGKSIDGDQLSWDGRDNEGDYVSSGVYLLTIYGKNNSQTVEKITVIKK